MTSIAAPAALAPTTKRVEGAARVIGGILRRPKGIIGTFIVALLLFLAIAGPSLAPYDPNAQDYDYVLSAPNGKYLFGTDNLGRDLLSRLLHGARISLQVGVMTIVLASIVGVTAGLIAAYAGGVVDLLIMRVADGIMAFPSLMLALALLAVLGPNLQNIIIAVAVGNIPKFARLARGQALVVGASDFVTAAKVLGASSTRIVARHVWPNSLDPIIVQASLTTGSAIILEAGLSFLGLGVQPPTPTWGWMLKSGYPFISTSPWVPMVPGFAIFFTVLGFNLLGDAVRDAIDPRISD